MPNDILSRNSKQMVESQKNEIFEGDLGVSEKYLSDIIDRIVNSLVEKTFVLTVEDGNVSIEKAEENENPVTEEELQKINNAVRPQLTGELMTV